jgi:thioredoxin-related protein
VLPCRPCKGVGKPYEKLAARYAKSAVFLKLFGNANAGCKRLFKSFKIRSTPSFLYFRAGENTLPMVLVGCSVCWWCAV